jgi:hypothetical protein
LKIYEAIKKTNSSSADEKKIGLFFQRNSGSGCKPKGPLEGHCTILFEGSEDDKTKNLFKFKKCFSPYRKDVKRISGTFVKDKLEV